MEREAFFGYFSGDQVEPRGVARVTEGDDTLRLEIYTPTGWQAHPRVLDDLKEPYVREITAAQAHEAMARLDAA